VRLCQIFQDLLINYLSHIIIILW